MENALSKMNPALVASTFALSLMACDNKSEGDDSDSSGPPECGDHGEWVVDHGHCHCDDGYELTADGNDCVPEADGPDGEDDTWGGDDTGEQTSTFQPDSLEATIYAGSPAAWVLVAKEGQTWLSIENYPSFGGATGPEARTLGAAEANYATCGICIMVQTGCEPHGDHSHCETSFMAEAGGEVVFEELGGAADESWSGALSDLSFVEVQIDSSTYESTPVEGGESLELEFWSFDVVLQAE